MNLRKLLPALLIFTLTQFAAAVPSLVEQVTEGVTMVRDDAGQWDGDQSKSITHQNGGEYWARKILDLTNVPADVWEAAQSVRLSAYMTVRDYSWRTLEQANGLDEAYEVVVNGHVNRFPTNCGAPVYAEGKPATFDWYDMPLPKEQFVRGENEIILRKETADKRDDYLYLGIDHTWNRGNSAVAFDGKNWRNDTLTVPGGVGEYMVRLYLLAREMRDSIVWRPADATPLADPAGMALYAGARGGELVPNGLRLSAGQTARVEWDPARINALEALSLSVDASAPVEVAVLDSDGKPGDAIQGMPETGTILPPPLGSRPSGIEIRATGPVTLRAVTANLGLSYHPRQKPIDMCPRISAPAGKPVERAPAMRMEGNAVAFENSGLRAKVEAGDRLRLVSLYNEITACEMVTSPDDVALFLVEVGDKRYAGSRDFQCRSVTADGETGLVAELALPDPALSARLTLGIDDEGLRMGLVVTNVGDAPVDFKVAFPHVAGLKASDDPAADYYFFPWGGGVIADRPAVIRKGYGDHEALYQVMDLFSPQRGGGLSVRADDTEGWHKVLALRKYIEGQGEDRAERLSMITAPEYKWTNSLDAVQGTGFAYEYQRRTRGPGAFFAPAQAVFSAHPGDWRVAMKAYADWAHGVWQFRPWPSRLKDVHHMIAAGWGQGILFKDGAYRKDIIRPDTDCIELMSWWDWSPLGPWGTPIDKVKEVLGESVWKTWQPYFVKDPVTGEMMWNNQPGDYLGYNERFGGLPAFRDAIQTYKDMGSLVTLYTDPFRMDDNSKIGKAHGKEWGVVLQNGEHSKGYEVWNPCHDTPAVWQWVAETMERVMRETGADGIRLDEYGHRGWACFSDLHEHRFSEKGVTQWNKGVAEATRMVREAMDRVTPGSVLTLEHPGYDYLMQYIDGTITYDVTVQATPLRPVECNLQRFYFPECKAYELDHRGADPQNRNRLWNAVASFGRYFPPALYALYKENADAFETRDCEAFIPTLLPRVYANRFTGNGKTFYHVINGTGHTVDGAVLEVEIGPEEHLFDMLNCREASTTRDTRLATINAYLPREEVISIAKLRKRMDVNRNGDQLTVKVALPGGECDLVVADIAGKVLVTVPASAETAISLSDLPEGAKPACVKLLREGYMVDVAEVGG